MKAKDFVHPSNTEKGMTARDHLASLAMQGMVGNMRSTLKKSLFGNPGELDPESIAKDFNTIPSLAYRMADMMIKESVK